MDIKTQLRAKQKSRTWSDIAKIHTPFEKKLERKQKTIYIE